MAYFLGHPVDTNVIRRKFYASANTFLANSLHQDDIVRLHLVESYSLPVLQYRCSAIKLNNAQINEINVCWNTMYRRIFCFHNCESVKTFIYTFFIDLDYKMRTNIISLYEIFICGLGRLDLCMCSFIISKSLMVTNNTILLCTIQCMISV